MFTYDGSHIPVLAWVLAGVVVTWGSITDIKTLEVPDWLNYWGIGLGLGLRVIYSAMESSWIYILEGLLGLGVFYLIALAMFYTGQWGGGDSKMLMAIGALLGIGFDPNSAGVAFFVNLIILGGVYGVLWCISLLLINASKVKSKFAEVKSSNLFKYGRLGSVTASFGLLGTAFLMPDLHSKFLISSLAVLITLMFYSIFIVRSIEESVMIRDVSLDKLTEGDWVVEDTFVGKERICGPDDLGLTLEQIKKLKSHKFKTLKVKYGMPFIPSFFFAFVATYFMGNIVLFIF